MKHTFSKQLLRISLTGLVTLLLLALGSNVLVGGQGPMPQQTAASQADGIDEVVVVGTDGYVYAYDYTGQLVYQSPGNGWSLAATGDFNRDGDDEIVAVGGNRIKVFDPQVNGTEYSLSRTYSGSTGTFTKVAVGHLVGDDNQLDIALLRSRGGTVSRIVIYRTSKAAPAVDYEFPYSNWDDFAVADFDGDGDDDFALIYWNNNYPDGVKSWLELWKGHDPSQRLQGSSNNGRYSNLEWFDIAAGNFVTTNGDRVEWVGAQNVNNVVVQQWKDERIRDVWAVGPAFEFVAAADFRGDGDDQVAMLRNVTSGVSLQFARSGDARFKPWAKTSGLGTGWLNLAAGNLDTETKYKEAVIIKNNLIRVYLRPQAGQNGDGTSLNCNTSSNCFEAFNLSSPLNGELAMGDLGSKFKKAIPYQTTPTTIIRTATQSTTIPNATFYIYGEKAVDEPLNWGAAILPDYTTLSLKDMAAQDPTLSLSITGRGIHYDGKIGSGQLPQVEWMALSAVTGTTPSTVTAYFSDTYAGSPIANPAPYNATILVYQTDIPNDRFRYVDVTVLVAGGQVYLPLLIK